MINSDIRLNPYKNSINQNFHPQIHEIKTFFPSNLISISDAQKDFRNRVITAFVMLNI